MAVGGLVDAAIEALVEITLRLTRLSFNLGWNVVDIPSNRNLKAFFLRVSSVESVIRFELPGEMLTSFERCSTPSTDTGTEDEVRNIGEEGDEMGGASATTSSSDAFVRRTHIISE